MESDCDISLFDIILLFLQSVLEKSYKKPRKVDFLPEAILNKPE